MNIIKKKKWLNKEVCYNDIYKIKLPGFEDGFKKYEQQAIDLNKRIKQ